MAERPRADRGALAVVAVTALLAAGCAAEDGPAGGGELDGVELTVAAVWTGEEEAAFQVVLDEFEARTGASVAFESTGEDIGAYLGPKVGAGEPPDIAALPQPGLVREYAERDQLVPLGDEAADTLERQYNDYYQELGTVDDEAYGVLAKVAHKSIVWYRPDNFDEAGVDEPATWDEMVNSTSTTLSEAGITPFAMCGAAGWTLTDWFENVYLSQAGPDAYDQLAEGELAWTDDTVVRSLETLAEIWGNDRLMLDGRDGAVQTGFPTCVSQVYGQDEAAMIMEADFVAAPAREAGATIGESAVAFPFPAVDENPPVVVAGDSFVTMTENEGVDALMAYLASAEAQKLWAAQGGYLSANSEVTPDSYADEFTSELAQTVLDAGEDARYDLSDQVPSGFGATEGSGMWAILQDFLRDPSDPEATAETLEQAASAAGS